MILIAPGKHIPEIEIAQAWYHGGFLMCPRAGDERVDVCLKRQEAPTAVPCFNGMCDIGLKVKESMGNLFVHELRKKVGDV